MVFYWEFGNLKGFEGKEVKEQSPLCEKEKNESHVLLKCTETKRWRE
jgi:hypothetical protein